MSQNADFWTHYSNLCSKAKLCPLKSVSRRLKGTELCCPVDVVRSEHWPLLLTAIRADTGLTRLEFVSRSYPVEDIQKHTGQGKRKSGLHFPTPYGCSEKNVSDISKCVAHLLSRSQDLKTLKIENLNLTVENALVLEKSFKDSNIELFSISGCKLQDGVFEIICRGLQLPNVEWIDLSSCSLQSSDITAICKLIKAHSIKNDSELFPHILRYQRPNLDNLKGLSRITLNNNNIGDEGVNKLVSCFDDDIWIKALDLQKCSVGFDGAKSLLNFLQRNTGLQLLDLRQNNIDESVLDRIALQLALNNVGKVVKYTLGGFWKPPKNTRRISCRKNFLKTKVLKPSPSKLKKSNRVAVKCKSIKVNFEEAYAQTSINYDREMHKARKIISKYNSLLKVLKRYKRENYHLHQEVASLSSQKDYVLIDHRTFAEVTSTFEKYKTFLDIMKDYGLWECIAMLEENESFKDILKPLVIEAVKQCIKIAKSDSSSARSLSQESNPLSSIENEMPPFRQRDHKRLSPRKHNVAKERRTEKETELFHRRTLHEMSHVTKPSPSHKALARKVFREVMESYTTSSHTSDQCQVKSAPLPPKVRLNAEQRSRVQVSGIRSSISETAAKLQQLKGQSGTRPKVVSPPVALRDPDLVTPESIFKIDSVKIGQHVIKPMKKVSSKSVSDGSSTLRDSRKAESDQSSVYRDLPQTKQPIPKSTVAAPTTPKKQSNVPISWSVSGTKSSSVFESETSSEPDARQSSKTRTSHHKISIHSSVSQRIPKSSKRVPETTSSASSVLSSRDDKTAHGDSNVHSSAGGIHSEESYLESVSEGSTDKDVKSFSKSEVYISDKKSSKKSVELAKDVILEESKVVKETSTKSPESKLSQKKASAKKSESSVPSLSDITTVSSQSLNTDSVMGQLSDN